MTLLYIFIAYLIFLLAFIGTNLLKANPIRTLAKDQNKWRRTGISFEEKHEYNAYTVRHVVDNAVVSFKGLKASAAHYNADFLPVDNSGHNLMMEKSTRG